LVMGVGALTVALWTSDGTQAPPRPPGVVAEI